MSDTPSATDPRLLVIRDEDNVCIACAPLDAGTDLTVDGHAFRLPEAVAAGHKIARRTIAAGEKIFKYGAPIGSASQDIQLGEAVHTHNLKSDYIASYTLDEARDEAKGSKA